MSLYSNELDLYGVTISSDGVDVDYVDPTEGPKTIPDITNNANYFLKVNSDATNIEWVEIGGDGDFSCDNCTFGSGDVANPSITFKTDTNTGLSNPASDTLSISVGGQERLTVGLNDTRITNDLYVSGNISASDGTLTGLNVSGIVQQNITGGDNGFFEISKNVENWQSNSNMVKDWFANMNRVQDTFNEGQSWWDVIYNDVLKLYVAISREAFNVSIRGTTNKVCTSPDGYTWTLRTTPLDAGITAQKRWHKIDYNRTTGTMICVSEEGSEGIMRSTDGINWVDILEPTNVSWAYISYFQHINTWIGSGNAAGRVMWSTNDGLTWTDVFSSFNYGPICYNSKTGFYYTGSAGVFRITTTPLNPLSWVQTSNNVAGTDWIVYSPDLNMVLCGGSQSGTTNHVSYSLDNGATFTFATISNDTTLNQRRSCIWCPRYKCFILTCCNASASLGNYGTPFGKVFYSFNGINWIDAGLPTSQFYWQLYYNQERDTLIISSLDNGNTANKFHLTNPNKLQPTANNLYNGIHQTMDNSGNWTFRKNVDVDGNISTTNITASGDMSLSGAMTTNLNIGASGAGNGKNLDVYGTTILRGNTDVGQNGQGNTANLKVWGDLEVTGNITGNTPAPSYNDLTLTGTTEFQGPLSLFPSNESASNPAIFFKFSPTTGIYSGGLNTINISAGGIQKIGIGSTLNIGTSTNSCPTTIYGNLDVKQNLTTRGDIYSEGVLRLKQLQTTENNPALCFGTDTETGMFSSSSGVIVFVSNGKRKLSFGTSSINTGTFDVPILHSHYGKFEQTKGIMYNGVTSKSSNFTTSRDENSVILVDCTAGAITMSLSQMETGCVLYIHKVDSANPLQITTTDVSSGVTFNGVARTNFAWKTSRGMGIIRKITSTSWQGVYIEE